MRPCRGRRRAADLSFRIGGITFAVNQGAEGVEKIMPFDLVPRVIVPEEWDRVSRGLEQRILFAVSAHLRVIFSKLGVASRTAAAHVARERQLV